MSIFEVKQYGTISIIVYVHSNQQFIYRHLKNKRKNGEQLSGQK